MVCRQWYGDCFEVGDVECVVIMVEGEDVSVQFELFQVGVGEVVDLVVQGDGLMVEVEY